MAVFGAVKIYGRLSLHMPIPLQADAPGDIFWPQRSTLHRALRSQFTARRTYRDGPPSRRPTFQGRPWRSSVQRNGSAHDPERPLRKSSRSSNTTRILSHLNIRAYHCRAVQN